MWLAIKVESLSLLTPSSKEAVFDLKYSDIEKVEVFSESVVIRKAGTIEVGLSTEHLPILLDLAADKVQQDPERDLREDKGRPGTELPSQILQGSAHPVPHHGRG